MYRGNFDKNSHAAADTILACVQILLAIVNESQGGTCKVCELASIIEF